MYTYLNTIINTVPAVKLIAVKRFTSRLERLKIDMNYGIKIKMRKNKIL